MNELVKAIQSDQDVGIAFPKIHFMLQPGIIQYAGNFSMNFYTGGQYCEANGQLDHGQFDENEYSMLAIGCCLVKKEVLEKIKGFDEIFNPY